MCIKKQEVPAKLKVRVPFDALRKVVVMSPKRFCTDYTTINQELVTAMCKLGDRLVIDTIDTFFLRNLQQMAREFNPVVRVLSMSMGQVQATIQEKQIRFNNDCLKIILCDEAGLEMLMYFAEQDFKFPY